MAVNTYCQEKEAEALDEFLPDIGYCVEFGAGDGYRLSNVRHLLESGWEGLQMDKDNKGNEEVKQEHITAENINELLDKYGVPEQFDLLSIDLDGNDYWIWKAITRTPKVVIIEYNPAYQDKRTINYNPDHVWNNDTYYGATYEALKDLGESKGYTCAKVHGCNVIFTITDKKYSPIVGYGLGHKSTERTDWVWL